MLFQRGCENNPFRRATSPRLFCYGSSPLPLSRFTHGGRGGGALSAATEQDKRFSRDQTKRTNGTGERAREERGGGRGKERLREPTDGPDTASSATRNERGFGSALGGVVVMDAGHECTMQGPSRDCVRIA